MNKIYMYFTIAIISIAIGMYLTLNPTPMKSGYGENQSINYTRELYVSGSAVKSIEPDRIGIILTIETDKKRASDSVNENSNITNRVIARLISLGVSKDNMSTNYYTVYPIYSRQNDTCIYNPPYQQCEQRVIGYKTINSLRVVVDPKFNVGKLIDNAIEAGANRVDSVYFFISEELRSRIEKELLNEAINDAKSKANILLSQLNMKVVDVKSISVVNYPVYPVTALPSYAGVSQTTPILPPQQTISVSVNVVFIIDKA